MSQITIKLGDNLEILKTYPDNHFDSVVTDAPYGLGKEPDALKLLQDWIDHGYHEIKGKGFMGKNWDVFVPQPIFWKEVFRVLKPGGHLLCFFGTRTYDWGVMAIRLAGFEIRDMITWHYGSGFPKSLDVSKAIDKAAGVEREVTGVDEQRKSRLKNQTGNYQSPNGLKTSGRSFDITEGASPEAKKYEGWGTALKPATEPICVARKPLCGTVAQNMINHGTGGINIDVCRIEGDEPHHNYGRTSGMNSLVGKGNASVTPSSGRFPANVIFDDFAADILDEQSGILTSGKANPIIKEYTSNIYGKYANNVIDINNIYADSGGASRFFYCAKPSQEERNAGAKNLITWENEELQQELMELRELLKDISEDGLLLIKEYEWNTITFGKYITEQYQKDFRCIMKMASRMITELKTLDFSAHSIIKEYIRGVLKTILETGLNLAENAEFLNQLIQNITSEKMALVLGVNHALLNLLLRVKEKGKQGNSHSTVKPIALMRWLQRLVTPVGGLTLDPFAGSGTSGCSAVFEGFDIVLLEAESDYLPIIEARTAYWQNKANREKYITQLKNSQTTLFA